MISISEKPEPNGTNFSTPIPERMSDIEILIRKSPMYRLAENLAPILIEDRG